MPWSDAHGAILKEAKAFAAEPVWTDGGGGRWRRKPDGTIYESKKIPQSVHVVWGKAKGKAAAGDPPVPHALLFPAEDWTQKEAKDWLAEREIDYLRLDEATGEEGGRPMDGEQRETGDLERRVRAGAEIRVERRDDGGPVIAGYAAVFEPAEADLGLFIERIRKGAFARALEERQDARALFNHDPNQVLGRASSGTLTLREDEKGLAFEIEPPDTQIGRDTVAVIERGDVDGCSFSFRTRRDEWTEPEDGPIERVVLDVDLIDVGPVTFPAYPDTEVAVRSLEAHRAAEAARAAGPPPAPEGHGNPDLLRRRLELAEADDFTLVDALYAWRASTGTPRKKRRNTGKRRQRQGT
ncbi:MAG: HK97 family phage prohead protease [Phycisphaerae bacterium]